MLLIVVVLSWGALKRWSRSTRCSPVMDIVPNKALSLSLSLCVWPAGRRAGPPRGMPGPVTSVVHIPIHIHTSAHSRMRVRAHINTYTYTHTPYAYMHVRRDRHRLLPNLGRDSRNAILDQFFCKCFNPQHSPALSVNGPETTHVTRL